MMMHRWTRARGFMTRRHLCTKKTAASDTKEAKAAGTLFEQLLENVQPLKDTTLKNFGEASRQAAKQARSAAEGFKKATDNASKAAASGAGAGAGKEDVQGDAGAAKKSLSFMEQVQSAINDVKDDLVSDAQRANPYVAGKARGLRREKRAEKDVEVNTEATGVNIHKDSKWYKQWEDFRETNKFVQGFFGMKMKFDESENLVVRSIRSVTERVEEGLASEDSETLQVMTAIKNVDPLFNREDFILEVEKQIFPGVLEALFKGDVPTLEKWCNEPTVAMLKQVIEHPDFKTRETKIIDIGQTDLVTSVFMGGAPVLVFASRVQAVEMERDSQTGKSIPKEDDKVKAAHYVLALSKDVERFGSDWEIVELAIQQEEGTFI